MCCDALTCDLPPYNCLALADGLPSSAWTAEATLCKIGRRRPENGCERSQALCPTGRTWKRFWGLVRYCTEPRIPRCNYVTILPGLGYPFHSAMLTTVQFRDYLQARRDAGHSLTAIGESLGVSHVAVGHWLAGKREPSSTVLILAERILRENAGEWPL
jgi:hypothetical protein